MQSELAYAITAAGPADAVELARVHVQAWRETYPGMLPADYLARMSPAVHARRWRFRLSRTAEITLLAEGRDGLAGYVSAEWSRSGAPGEAEITTIYVLKDAQGLGLGRALFVGAARVLAARGATSMIVWVLRDNSRARGFYAKLGGAPAGERTEPVAGGAVPALAYRWSDLQGWLSAA